MVNRISDDEIERILKKFDADQPPSVEGAVAGKPVFDFGLLDQTGTAVRLTEFFRSGPVMLVFHPNDYSFGATEQLADYGADFELFKSAGVQIVAISSCSVEQIAKYMETEALPFPMIRDADNLAARAYYGTSNHWMINQGSRGVFLVSGRGVLLHKLVQPAALAFPQATKMLTLIADLKAKKLL